MTDEKWATFWLAVAVSCMVALWLIFAWIKPALAQEHGHPPEHMELHSKFYKTWMQPDNRAVSCCHDDDCQPAEARRLPSGQWEARQEGDKGNFTPIPPRKEEMDRDNPDGRNHLCGRRYGPGSDFMVYCFIAGQGT